jgi:hypothetical protein
MSDILTPEANGRRAFVRGAGFAIAGLAAASLLLPASAEASAIPSSIPGAGDIQVLNYALALEDLEADLYAQAILRLTSGGTDPQAASTVGTIVGLNVSGIDVTYLQKFAPIETAHRDFLKSALGSAAITTIKPAKYDFGIQNMTRQQVLDLVLEAEATGVQAYLGAIPSLTTKSPYAQTAAAIQGTEARHTTVLTIVRNVLSAQGVVSDPIAPVAPLKGDSGTTPTATGYNSADPNAGTPEGRDLAMDPAQVLARVSGFIKYQ